MRYVLVFLFIVSQAVYADNIGVHGTVYPIAEQDFLQFIQSRLITLDKNGEIARHQQQFKERALASADRPLPVNRLSKAEKNRIFYWDPTVILSDKPFNPLSQMSLTRTLLFYDGDDPEQTQWVHKINEQAQEKTILILVKGSITDQSNRFKRAIYFDQGGKLTEKFGIRHIPAVVTQDKLRLRIEEVKL